MRRPQNLFCPPTQSPYCFLAKACLPTGRQEGGDQCESSQLVCSGGCSPFSRKAGRYSAKQNHLKGAMALAVGLHIFILTLTLTGCASYVRKSPAFNSTLPKIKKIAVMPLDVKMYQITAGGVKEERDEWTQNSQQFVEEALRQELNKQGFEANFISKDWLKANHREVWEAHKSLYEAIVVSTLMHAYSGPNVFPTKIKNYDYTFGEEFQTLSSLVEGDAVLFIFGYDHEATMGRKLLWWWNLPFALYTGAIQLLPNNPSLLTMAFVDSQSGDVQWFKCSDPNTEYSFRNQAQVKGLVKWLLEDLKPKK